MSDKDEAKPGSGYSNPVSDPLLQFFEQLVTGSVQGRALEETFTILARDIVQYLPRNAERTVALRKLLEARDAAVRAVMMR